MNIEWGSDAARKFVTNVGLTTSNGPHGYDIMATEWTHHMSYSPGLIAVCIHPSHATAENIRASKQFGVNLCSQDQNVVSSIAGGSSGREVNKIEALKELGVEFYKGKIDVWMVKGASLNVECKLVKEIDIGSHIIFIGEALSVSHSDKRPLVYHDGKYWEFGNQIQKPQEKERERINKIVEKYSK